ncbi:MAG: hypothetical protein Q4G12_02505, partial [Bacteroidales bacterium]|nr:hypothetical protein [Bacteroidales bacterium]
STGIAKRLFFMFLFQSPQHLSTDRISLRLFRITFAAYLPTHIKFLTEFHRIFFGIMAQKNGVANCGRHPIN